MEAEGSVETQAADPATSGAWLVRLSGIVAITLLPALVVSQWLALRWELPTRFLFNAVFGAACVVLFIAGWHRLPRWLRWLGFSTAGILVISWLVNGVAPSTVLRGTLPYAIPVVAVAAGFGASLAVRDLRLAAHVHAWLAGVLAVIAVLQLTVGEAAYRWFGQDLAYPRWWERGRATGLVVNPGRLAQVGFVTAAIAPVGTRAAVSVGLGAILVAASGGRIALLGAFVLLGTGMLFPHHRRAYVGAAAAVTVALAVVLAVSPLARDDLLARTEASIDDATDADQIIEDTRVASLRAGLDAWQAAPVIGWGPGRFGSTTAWASGSELHDRYGLPDLRSEEFQESLRAAGDDREIDVGNAQPDIGFLQILTETGIVGLGATLVLLTGVAHEAFRRRRSAGFALVGLISLFSLTGPGIADPSLALVALWWAGALVNR